MLPITTTLERGSIIIILYYSPSTRFFFSVNAVQRNHRKWCTWRRRVSVLFDGAPVGGRISVSGADDGAEQRPQRWPSGGRGHQEARVRRQKAQVPAGKGAESVHHAGHHHERVHRVLVTVLRAGVGQAVPQRPVQHTQLAEQPVLVAGLRQLATQSREYNNIITNTFFNII